MHSHSNDLLARAVTLFAKQRKHLYSGGFFPVWTESEQATRREISAMAPRDLSKFQSDMRNRIARGDLLDGLRRVDHVRECLDALRTLPDEALESLPREPQGTFEEWFWARCRRLGIEAEFRAQFEEWKRNRADAKD